MQSTFPFTAITGQESLKTALILSTIEPKLGGLLISGPRGCGKSTAARSLSDLTLDPNHFVNLPLGASEDRVIGSINAQNILDNGEISFSPGLLHKAHQGMLYVDEVNLLPDHLIDILLDVSASGKNFVERDTLSHQHDAQFVLIGTMNPDEGELRPQILDRFGLMVQLKEQLSIEERVRVTGQRLSFDADPASFCAKYDLEQQALKSKIVRAQTLVASVAISEAIQVEIATLCYQAQVDGMRADITLTRAAKAYCAFCGETEITQRHIDAVKELVLCHRRNDNPSPPDSSSNNSSSKQSSKQSSSSQPSSEKQSKTEQNSAEMSTKESTQSQGQWGALEPTQVAVSDEHTFKKSIKHPEISALKKKPQDPVTNARSNQKPGLNLSKRLSESGEITRQVDWLSTILKNNPISSPKPEFKPKPTPKPKAKYKHRSNHKRFSNLEFKRRKSSNTHLHILLVDTSSSSIGGDALKNTKGVIEHVARQAYLQRELLCIIQFGNDSVSIVQSPKRPPKSFTPVLRRINAGGGTPLRKALKYTEAMFKRWDQNQQHPVKTLYLFTDGRTNDVVNDIQLSGELQVIDTESTAVRLGRCKQLASGLGADYVHIDHYLKNNLLKSNLLKCNHKTA